MSIYSSNDCSKVKNSFKFEFFIKIWVGNTLTNLILTFILVRAPLRGASKNNVDVVRCTYYHYRKNVPCGFGKKSSKFNEGVRFIKFWRNFWSIHGLKYPTSYISAMAKLIKKPLKKIFPNKCKNIKTDVHKKKFLI